MATDGGSFAQSFVELADIKVVPLGEREQSRIQTWKGYLGTIIEICTCYAVMPHFLQLLLLRHSTRHTAQELAKVRHTRMQSINRLHCINCILIAC